jgi:hypothetical protein
VEAELDALAAETSFSGAVQVDDAGGVRLARAYGRAHRGFGIRTRSTTRFAAASARGLPALRVAVADSSAASPGSAAELRT